MKKKLIITSSLITILLALFPVSLYAEQDVQDPAPANPSVEGTLLDSYFYQNYDILPYIESDGNQYIDTGINPTENIIFNLKFSAINQGYEGRQRMLFGSNVTNNTYFGYVQRDNGLLRLSIYTNISSYNVLLDSFYEIHNLKISKNKINLDSSEYTIDLTNLSNNLNIYLFGRNPYNNLEGSYMRVYNCSIYDSSINDGNGGYVRYFYPAKAKTSGAIGLYDSVSKTFFPSLGSDPFENPTDDKVLHFQIGDFITAGLTWIGDIFDFVIDTPIILFFMAVGLAGAMYRWARRIVHF